MSASGRTRQSQQARAGCGCPDWTAARNCWDLRYYGYSPIRRGPGSDDWTEESGYTARVGNEDDGVCECACHDEDDWEDER